MFFGYVGSLLSGVCRLDCLAGLNSGEASINQQNQKRESFNPYFETLSGGGLFLIGCIGVLYFWWRVHHYLATNMQLARNFALLLFSAVLIWIGMAVLITHFSLAL